MYRLSLIDNRSHIPGVIHGSPSRCGWLEIPGASQVDKEENTGVPLFMSLCEVRCCCTALLDCMCTAPVLLQVRRSVGWNRPDCVQDGTHAHARTYTETPFVAVTKGRP